jgi:hypothetical protein
MSHRKKTRGSALLEFAFTGVPLIFVLISIAQMGIGMWRYHTLQYAVKTAGAYLTKHGADCAVSPNSCTVQIKDAAQVLANAAFSVPSSSINLTFSAVDSDHTTVRSTVTCQLSACLNNTTTWPPASYNNPGQDVRIKADYVFSSALSMVAPGAGSPVSFGTFHFPGYTQQTIIF